MHAGFPDQGIAVNPAKTRLNFDMLAPNGGHLARNVWHDGTGRAFIKWCGLLLNEQTLELQADYTRYAGHNLLTAMALPLHKVGSGCACMCWFACPWL